MRLCKIAAIEGPHTLPILRSVCLLYLISNIQTLSFLGYDKLKPYGFPIPGAVDGFSRRILWLEVARSNNDPRVPAAF